MTRLLKLVVVLQFILSGIAFAQSPQEKILSAEASLRGLRAEIVDLQSKLSEAVAGDVDRLTERKKILTNTYRVQLWKLADQVSKQEDSAQSREQTLDLLSAESKALKDQIKSEQDQIRTLQLQSVGLSDSEQQELDIRILDKHAYRDEMIGALINNATKLKILGNPALADVNHARVLLKDRADLLSGRISLDNQLQKRLRKEYSVLNIESDEARGIQLQLNQIFRDLKADSERLNRISDMLESINSDATLYRQTAFFATGQLSGDYLDTRVAGSIINQWLQQLKSRFIDRLPHLMSQALILVIILAAFWALSRLVKAILKRWLSIGELGMSNLARDFLVGISGKLVILVGVLVALSQLGLQIGPLLAGLGIVGFIVGFALQDTLSNFASGVMILVYRPFDEGDYVKAAGVEGTVRKMNLVSTTVYTSENHRLVIPNNKIWGDIIRNVTSQHMRRVDMVFGVSYSDDIDKVQSILEQLVSAHPRILSDPPAVIRLNKLADSAVEFIVRPWAKSEHYLEVYWDLQKQVKKTFDQEGITFPFPQREITINNAETSSSRDER